jgi:hypothetical protein
LGCCVLWAVSFIRQGGLAAIELRSGSLSDAEHGYTQFILARNGYTKARATNKRESDVTLQPTMATAAELI